MLLILGLIAIVVGLLGLFHLIALSLNVSIIVIVIGLLLALWNGGRSTWHRPGPPAP